MNNLDARNSELVNVHELAETDIFQMLMVRDRVAKHDFLKLCDEARSGIKASSTTLVSVTKL